MSTDDSGGNQSDGIECPWDGCEREFNSDRGVKVHHTKAHGKSIAGVTLECAVCGEEFTTLPSKADERRFCSPQCVGSWASEERIGENAAAWSGGKVEIECRQCGDTFRQYPSLDRLKHCSRDCYDAWQRENKAGPNHNRWAGGVENYGAGWNESKREAVLERDGRVCQSPKCGRTEAEHVEKFGCKHAVHHIQKARQFDSPEARNAMENLITLCAYDCHRWWEKMSPLRPQIE